MMVAVPRLLMIIGSGETSPTMVTAHQQVFARLGAHARGVQLDSPYGFQENADELTDKGRQYFAESVGHDIEAVTFRSAPPQDAVAARHRDGPIARGRLDFRRARQSELRTSHLGRQRSTRRARRERCVRAAQWSSPRRPRSRLGW